MEESTILTNLINAGSAGLVILVVVLFLKFLTTERDRSNEQHESMMCFIKEQRTSNNDANVKAAALIAEAQAKAADQTSDTYVQVAEAMKSLTMEIRLLKDSHIAHDTLVRENFATIKTVKPTTTRKPKEQ